MPKRYKELIMPMGPTGQLPRRLLRNFDADNPRKFRPPPLKSR